MKYNCKINTTYNELMSLSFFKSMFLISATWEMPYFNYPHLRFMNNFLFLPETK